jgi:hypothetical protein
VHCDAADVLALHLDLARVHTAADLQTERRRAVTIALAHRTARAGPSKVARKPSPSVLISRPRKRSISRRTT